MVDLGESDQASSAEDRALWAKRTAAFLKGKMITSSPIQEDVPDTVTKAAFEAAVGRLDEDLTSTEIHRLYDGLLVDSSVRESRRGSKAFSGSVLFSKFCDIAYVHPLLRTWIDDFDTPTEHPGDDYDFSNPSNDMHKADMDVGFHGIYADLRSRLDYR
jgi:hypothetical protein